MDETTLLILTIVLLLLGNGFFSGSEIALISARRSRIEALANRGSRAAKRVKDLQDDPTTLLATVQIGVTLMGTLAGIAGGYLASRHLEPRLAGTWLAGWVTPAFVAGSLVGGGIVYVELILGELVPKALALRFTERVALLVAWPLHAMARGSRWLVAVLTASTRAVLWVVGVRAFDDRELVSEEEIRHLVREGQAQGVFDSAKSQLLHRVLEFTETPVRKVMVPRPKVFALDAATPPEQVGRLVVESGFSRIPVYDAETDNFLGQIFAKDVLRLLERGQPPVLRRMLHPVAFVPETRKLGPLMQELQKKRAHLGLVVDEHGVVSGLVTLEDLLEEIVGEIDDEYDREERQIEVLRDGSLVVEGTVPASEVRKAFDVPIPESEEFETVAGFLLARLGALPRGGESVDLEGFRFTVVDVERNRITKVKIERREA